MEEKTFFGRIKEKISNFFKTVINYICSYFIWGFSTVLVNKVVWGIMYFPNKIAAKLKNNTRKAVCGVVFVLPLMIGFIYFFLIPFIYTVWYSFGYVYIQNGRQTDFVGLNNYIYIFTEATRTKLGETMTFTEDLVSTVISIAADIPIILIFSLIMAVVLNSKFKGRAVCRAIFFMPVIFNSQAINIAQSAYTTLTDSMENSTNEIFETMFSFKEFLQQANVPLWAVTFLGNASDKIYDVISYSGIQILIFLSAIQSVPRNLYEAAKMEGATQYEMFWKITFPMVSPMLLAAAVYTVVDSFLRSPLIEMLEKYSATGVINVANTDIGYAVTNETTGDVAYQLSNYGVGSAMALIYCLVVVAIIGIVLGILSKVVFYYDE